MPRSTPSNPRKTIAIVGLPNTGKSQVFNRLTGTYSLVANYSRTTIVEKRATCRVGDQVYEIIDTPGLHGLYIHSEEDLAVRTLLYSEQPDAVIQCVSASHLRRSLTLTADLLEMGIPLVVCLNAVDETARNGIWVDSALLQEKLGVPVVETVATEGQGIRALKVALAQARKGIPAECYGESVTRGVGELTTILDGTVPYSWRTSALLLQNDPFIADLLKERLAPERREAVEAKVLSIREAFAGSWTRAILEPRGRWVNGIADIAIRKRSLQSSSFPEQFAHLSRHPVYGVAILLIVVFAIFAMVVKAGGLIDRLLTLLIVNPVVGSVTRAVPEGFLRDFLVGHYGLLTLGLFNAVCTVLPILGMFFLGMGFLEDLGYIPNLCVLTGRLFDKLGLSGKSIMSLVLAFGCRTMATLTTRGLSSFKEKFIANYLIAFAIPCSAQLALLIGVLGRVGFVAFLVTFGAIVLATLATGVFLNRIIKQEERGDFIQELPPARVPSLWPLLVKTGHRLRWFLKEAVPIFLVAAVVLFGLDCLGVLNALERLLHPVIVGWLGLPPDLVPVLILCVARKEAAIGLLLGLAAGGSLTPAQIIVSAILVTMFIPCSAHVVALVRELGVKMVAIMIPAIMLTALLLAGVLSHILAVVMGAPQ